MSRSLLVFVLAFAGMLAAQDPPSRAGRISYVSGTVSFEPAGVDNWVAAIVNRPLTMGDQLYADNGGRAEVHLPGTAFRLGDRAAFEFMNLDDQTAQVRLSEGALDVRIRRLDGNLEVDTPNLAFSPSRPGEYRIDVNVDNGQTYVTVRDGAGQVTTGAGSITVNMGQQAVVMGQGQAAQYKINAAPGYDSFDRWVMSRSQREDRYAYSHYVSPEMVGYEDLGEYGTWRNTPDYGDVWLPNGVAAGWAPYRDGHWAWIDPWGWTWVDDAPWGFAPFHYGRWAYVNGYWGWCPGPVATAPVYAPALVAWVGFGAGFGISAGVGGGPAVGWFPLGPRDVYIPAFTASAAFVTRVNITNTTVVNSVNVTNVYSAYQRTRTIPVDTYMNRTVPGAVVAVPPSALASARPVRDAALRVEPNQLAAIHTADPAPRVAPQLASVLGHSPGGHVPQPTAAVLSRPVVARTTPPPRPASFESRQSALARQPGRPVPVAELHQLAQATPAGRPNVSVVNPGHPMPAQVAHVQTAPSHAPPPAQPQRPFEPPAAQRTPQPAASQPHQPMHPQRQLEPAARRTSPPAETQPRPATRPAPQVAHVQHASPPAVHPAPQAVHQAPPARAPAHAQPVAPRPASHPQTRVAPAHPADKERKPPEHR